MVTQEESAKWRFNSEGFGVLFEQAFKNIDDVLRKEAGCTTELDYTEQTSWLLFLKYLDGLEQDKADEAALEGKKYAFILDKPYRWEDLGRAQRQGRPDRPQQGEDRRRPARLRQRQALSLPARLQAEGQRPEHHRIQNRRDLRRDQKQDPERLQPARDHRPHRRTALPLADREARAVATSTKPRSRTWATPGATAASTTPRAR